MAEEGKGRARRTEQVNIRLSPEELDVARAAAFLADLSVGRLLQAVVVENLAARGDTPEVVATRTARQRYKSKEAGELADLAGRRKRKPKT